MNKSPVQRHYTNGTCGLIHYRHGRILISKSLKGTIQEIDGIAGNNKKVIKKDADDNAIAEAQYIYDSKLRPIFFIETTRNQNPECRTARSDFYAYEKLPSGSLKISIRKHTCSFPGENDKVENIYTYNSRGQKTEEELYKFNDRGNLFELTSKTGYVYEKNGTLSKIQLYDIQQENGSFSASPGNYVTFEYDEHLFLSSRKSFYANGTPCVDLNSGLNTPFCIRECSTDSICYSKSIRKYGRM